MSPRRSLLFIALITSTLHGAPAGEMKTAAGKLQGSSEKTADVLSFKGIPFAQPPVGDLRWKAPQPAKKWSGVRNATAFGPRCMQSPLYSDQIFRSASPSEDCLYLNIWTPAKSSSGKLPVLVYFFGGGFITGDGSEFRYDGESMARKGIVAVTVNYRLGVLGFLAHPELTKESPNRASGNHGFLDQVAALRWVRENIASFGGDPKKITIAGESAGSTSVSALMVSPLSRDLIAGAIGESGSILSARSPISLAQAEEAGAKFAASLGDGSISALRSMTAEQIHAAASKTQFPRVLDGYFLPENPMSSYTAGKQARVPLLAGWNSEEAPARAVLGREQPTPESFTSGVRRLYPEGADEVLKVYPASTNDEVLQAATDLATDRSHGFTTWRWTDLHAKTGQPVYRYYFSRARPAMRPESGSQPTARGAVHASEIDYALGNLAYNKFYEWTPEDFKVSQAMQEFFANFIKTGNPNGPGLPVWPPLAKDGPNQVMHIDVETLAKPETTRERYLVLEKLQQRR